MVVTVIIATQLNHYCEQVTRLHHSCEQVTQLHHSCEQVTQLHHSCEQVTQLHHSCEQVTQLHHYCEQVTQLHHHCGQVTLLYHYCEQVTQLHHYYEQITQLHHSCEQVTQLHHYCEQVTQLHHYCEQVTQLHHYCEQVTQLHHCEQVSENLLSLYLDGYDETPWDALKYLIAGINYGGHVTDDWDRRLLMTYINDFFVDNALTQAFFKWVAGPWTSNDLPLPLWPPSPYMKWHSPSCLKKHTLYGMEWLFPFAKNRS